MTNSICHLDSVHTEKKPVFSKEKIILVHTESVIQSRIHNDSIFITSLKFIPFRFSSKSSVKSNLLLSLPVSLLVATFILYLPCFWIKVKAESWVHEFHFFTLFILCTLLFHLCVSQSIGFDDSSIDAHTIGIRDFSCCLLPECVCECAWVSNQQTMRKVYWVREKIRANFQAEISKCVDPFLSTFHSHSDYQTNGALRLEQYVTSCNIG